MYVYASDTNSYTMTSHKLTTTKVIKETFCSSIASHLVQCEHTDIFSLQTLLVMPQVFFPCIAAKLLADIVPTF